MTKTASRFATIILAAISTAALTSAAQAAPASQPGIHVQVGNLKDPAQAAQFRIRLDAAAESICNSREMEEHGPSAWAVHRDCLDSVHEEGLSQLSDSGRIQVAKATTRQPMMLAGR
jgi:UrcA family protein